MYSDDEMDDELETKGSGNKVLDFYNNNKKMLLILLGLVLIIVILAIASSCTKGNSGNNTTNGDTPVLSINSNQITIAKKNTAKLTAVITNIPGAILNWQSSDTNVAIVDDQGLVTGVNYGTAKVTAVYLHTDGHNYEVSCDVTVAEGDTSIELTSVSFPEGVVVITKGNDYELPVTMTPVLGYRTNESYTSTNSDVVTVDETGKIKAVGTGKAIVKINVNNGQFTDEITVNVVEEVVETKIVILPTSINFNQNVITMSPSNSISLEYQYLPVNANISDFKWASSNPNVATVISGIVTSVGVGEATITVSNNNGLSASVRVIVEDPTVYVTALNLISSNNVELIIYNTATIQAEVLPNNATNKGITYTSSNSAVATVDANGLITANGVGTCVITLKSNDQGKTASVTVVVKSYGNSSSSSSDSSSSVGGFSWKSDTNGALGTGSVENDYSSSVENYATKDVTLTITKIDSNVTSVKYCVYQYGTTPCVPSNEFNSIGYTISLSGNATHVIRYIKYNGSVQSQVMERFVTIKGSSSSTTNKCYYCSDGKTDWGQPSLACQTELSGIYSETECFNYKASAFGNFNFALQQNEFLEGSNTQKLIGLSATYNGGSISKLYVCVGNGSCTVSTSTYNIFSTRITAMGALPCADSGKSYLVNSSYAGFVITSSTRIGIIAVATDGTVSNQMNYTISY